MSGQQSLSAKTVYNHSTDDWEVLRDGSPVKGRAAILAIPAGTSLVLKRGSESKSVTVSGDDPTSPAADAVGAVLDGLVGLREADIKVLGTLLRGWERNAARSEALADAACKVAERTADLNEGLSVALARSWGDNFTLMAAMRTMPPNPNERPQDWLDRVIAAAPQLAGLWRMLNAPLPPADAPAQVASEPAKEP